MMQIGKLTIAEGAWLAPMAGVTDMPFRKLCWEMGCAFATTEMVSAKGFLCAPENRLAVQSLLERDASEGPLALQLFGHEPDVTAEAVKRLEGRGFAAIDLNMGCPAPKITGGGDGSALMQNIPLAARMIAAARKATALPLTVKMRIGWDAEHVVAVEFAQMAEAEGVDGLAVHGRTRMQFYAGEADWSQIAAVKAAVRVPVVGNGDIASAADALARMQESGCDAVMIGRGATGNPWIFRQVKDALAGRPVVEPTAQARVDMAVRHAKALIEWKDEAVAIREMRKHGAWYTRGLPGAVQARGRIQAASTLAEFEAAMRGLGDTVP